jgi:tRNA (adenine22-N1)-methyltransferase
LKLSKRLKQIETMVLPNYTHVWDCCCDHGFLGAALLSKGIAQTVHFVDIVPKLIEELEIKLERFHPHSIDNLARTSAKNVLWKTHCIDVAQLPLSQYKGNHLVIIAGIGGDLMNEFIKSIHQNHKDLAIDFLLCPVHHQFSLRQNLISLNFSLQNEVLVEENKRFYEIMLVSSPNTNKEKNESQPIHSVGSSIWQSTSLQQSATVKQYLTKTLNHYERIQRKSTNDVQHIIDAYQTVLVEL